MMNLLLQSSPSQQKHFYDPMFRLSSACMTAEQQSRLDSVVKLDLSNSAQFADLLEFYSHNVEAICYWMNNCVFPGEMKAYPEKLVSSAWDLADGGHVVGFSGTDDNEMLLPLTVQMKRIRHPEIEATKGKMVHLILANPVYHAIEVAVDGNMVAALVQMAVAVKASALIDCGGLLAGCTNRQVATLLLAHFEAVTFFDTETRRPRWRIKTKNGTEYDTNSAVKVSSTFVIFDDSRCRGSDFQLLPDAKALLTLGVGMHKDKLLQAAGRLRGLQFEQKVEFAGAADVTTSIARLCGCLRDEVTSKSVLEWVIDNSLASTADGMLMWAVQGDSFVRRSSICDIPTEPEKYSLRDFYLKSSRPCSLHARMNRLITECNSDSAYEKVLEQIRCHVVAHVSADYYGMDEECERELEQEQEMERERETELPVMKPSSDIDWNYALVADASFEQLILVSGAISIDEYFGQYFSVEIATKILRIPWVLKGIYVTRNFVHTIDTGGDRKIDTYFRLIDGYLVHPAEVGKQRILLLSDREADCLHVVTRVSTLAYTTFAGDDDQSTLIPRSAHTGLYDCDQFVLMKLFNGCTCYETETQKQSLKGLLSAPRASEAAFLFPTMRGLQHMIDKCDLDVVVKTHCI
jgi:hypothetical protein